MQNLFYQNSIQPVSQDFATLGEQDTELLHFHKPSLPSDRKQQQLVAQEYNLQIFKKYRGANYTPISLQNIQQSDAISLENQNPLLETETSMSQNILFSFTVIRKIYELIQLIITILQHVAVFVPFLQLFFTAKNNNTNKESVSTTNSLSWIAVTDKNPNPIFACKIPSTKQQGSSTTKQQQRFDIYLFNVFDSNWCPLVLRHDFHKNVSTIASKPNSPNLIAIGCEYGICLWDTIRKFEEGAKGTSVVSATITENSSNQLFADASAGLMFFLKHEMGIDDLIWWTNPSLNDDFSLLRHLIVCCSKRDHRLILFYMEKDGNNSWKKTYITKFNGGIRKVCFSPNQQYLIATHDLYASFRLIYMPQDTIKMLYFNDYKTEKWSTSKPVKHIQWSSNSEYLLFSEEGSHLIRVLRMGNFEKEYQNRQLQHTFDIDLSPYEIEEYVPPSFSNKSVNLFRNVSTPSASSETDEEDLEGRTAKSFLCCGTISSFALDPHGERLVISFEESNDLLAVYQCNFGSLQPTVLMPLGFIRAPPGCHTATELSFCPQFSMGSLLSVVWKSNNKIMLYPFYYM